MSERERYEYFVDVAGTGRYGDLIASCNDLGRKGWRLVAVVPVPAPVGEPGDVRLFWERRRGERREARGESKREDR